MLLIDLAPMERELLSRASREKFLDRALKPVRGNYGFILADCPPQLSILTISTLSCAYGAIIPVKTDYLAYRGLTNLQDSIQEIQELITPGLGVLGVIATLYEKRAADDNEILAVVEQAPGSDISREYNAIADMMIAGKFEREDIYHG